MTMIKLTSDRDKICPFRQKYILGVQQQNKLLTVIFKNEIQRKKIMEEVKLSQRFLNEIKGLLHKLSREIFLNGFFAKLGLL